MKKELQDTRQDYQRGFLRKKDVAADPIDQFMSWLSEYTQLSQNDINLMTLSTVSPDGQPSARIVLLKGVDQGGFEFYTNYQSEKGQEIAENPRVSLNFFWPELERQVRIEGKAMQMEASESDEYFESRPRGSRIGAWASPQSQVIARREILEQRQSEFEGKFGEKVPRPPHWGGYRVMPHRVEFWQGRASRLHDRINYRLENDHWVIERLAP